MGKVIKKGATVGDMDTDVSVPDLPSLRSNKIISSERYEAKSEAQGIRSQAQGEAEDIIGTARRQAEEMIRRAQGEAEQIKVNAKKQGYHEGREQGAAELSEVVATTSARLQKIEGQIVPQLKQLSLAIAKKILGKELEFHPEAVILIIKQALAEKARQRQEIFLRVNPADLDVIRAHKADLLEVLSRCKEIGIREDPEVARYGVIIETDAGTIDAQLETQLAVFERVLKSP